MATSNTTLKMSFKDALDKSKTISLNYADRDAESEDVKTLVNTIIAKGSIFSQVPVTATGAEFVTQTIIPVPGIGE